MVRTDQEAAAAVTPVRLVKQDNGQMRVGINFYLLPRWLSGSTYRHQVSSLTNGLYRDQACN